MIGAMVLRIGNRRGWKAFNRGDLAYFDRYLADDVVYEVAGRPPFGGRFVGKTAWHEANRRWMDSVAAFRIRVVHEGLTHPFALGLTNTVLTEYELIERTPDGRTFRTRGIDVSEIRRGKLVAARNYLFDQEGEAALHAPTTADRGAEGSATDRRRRLRPAAAPA
jgi:ketosteroid isomerase-like protein